VLDGSAFLELVGSATSLRGRLLDLYELETAGSATEAPAAAD
jgi:hypothetical protein